MDYYKKDDNIIIPKCKEFNPQHILECGQIFRFIKNGEEWTVFSGKNVAKIRENDKNYAIFSTNACYFANFFDFETDYAAIKNSLKADPILAKCIPFGEGIRILRGDPFEIIISFVISQNNNIKRIQKIIERLCEAGEEIKFDGAVYHAFPTAQCLAEKPFKFFASLGAGYRDKFLYKITRELKGIDLNEKATLSTKELRKWLISLSGVGPKVADCILLFGFGRMDVFPVDTWVEQVYNTLFFEGKKNREQIALYFVNRFGDLSGYAQQYLFYSARSFDVLKTKSSEDGK